MNIWKCNKWKKIYEGHKIRSGLRLRFDKGIDDDVKEACKDFCKWLRKEYVFPMRVPIYVKNAKKIRARDGDLVYGTCLQPFNMLVEPYIRISAGDYHDLLLECGKDDALIQYLHCIAHELTHYFQWVNQLELTHIGEERQATRYADMIIEDYLEVKNEEKDNLLNYIEDKAYENGITEGELGVLSELSFDNDEYIRGRVAQILVNSDNEKGEEILIRLAGDSDSLVRTQACNSLCISDSVTTYELLKNIAIKDRNGMVRGYAINSLGYIATIINKQNKLIKFLENRLLEEKVVFTRINLYTTLYRLGAKDYLSNLLAMINTKRYQDRCEVVDNLYEIVNDSNKEMILKSLVEQRKIEKSWAVISTIDNAIAKLPDMLEIDDIE